MTLYFASTNSYKIEEISQKLPSFITLLSLNDLNHTEELAETSDTLEKNSLQKSKFIHDLYHVNCFADDTGLEIEALHGKPGVYSARYAGEEKNAQKNRQLVLEKLQNIENRKAQFRTVITLILDQKIFFFEGIVEGIIGTEEKGTRGFGYDSLFIPKGYTQTFGEMTIEQKNKFSHRGLALQKMIDFLESR